VCGSSSRSARRFATLSARHTRLGARAPSGLRTMPNHLVARLFAYLQEPRRVVTAPDGLRFYWASS